LSNKEYLGLGRKITKLLVLTQKGIKYDKGVMIYGMFKKSLDEVMSMADKNCVKWRMVDIKFTIREDTKIDGN